jgi:hypothetical protein
MHFSCHKSVRRVYSAKLKEFYLDFVGGWIMTIYMTAQWQCQADAESIVTDALRQFVAAVKQNEPHT